MSVNGISNAAQSYESNSASRSKTAQSAKKDQAKQPEAEAAAVYEKSEPEAELSKKVYTRDQVTIDRLKAEAERHTQSLRDLVNKLLLQQGETVTEATDLYQLLREGKVQVDDETRLQAQKDIAEDGYWGAEQTSNRMVEFAKALSGSDPSKADELIGAVKKGFEEAAKAWGGELPDLCKKTIDSTISKLEAWRDGKESQ